MLQGLFSRRWHLKIFNLMLGLANLATACMGTCAAGSVIKSTFANAGAATAFGCTAPVRYVRNLNPDHVSN